MSLPFHSWWPAALIGFVTLLNGLAETFAG
jgi:hypothetical protein